ncbi:hypothetical protein PIB30_106684, partial [Stylosanthes scabra]|nr:hypothetical protein [Stylosanthes scabra]
PLVCVFGFLFMQGSRRDKQIIEFDPEIERTLTKNRHRVRTQRSLQVDREEASSEDVVSEKYFEEEILEESIKEEIQHNMADHTNQRRTITDYQNPSTTSCGSSIVCLMLMPTISSLNPLWFNLFNKTSSEVTL